MKIAVVGLGYVGLPLCLQFGHGGVEVLSLDIGLANAAAFNSAALVAPEKVWEG